MDEHKVRVNGAMIAGLPDKAVILAGEVLEEQGSTLVLRAADGVKVNINFEDPPLDLSKFVEVTGRANPDGTIEGWITTNIGDNFDLPTYNNAIQLIEKFPQPFQG